MNKKLIVAALGLCVLVATPAAFAQTSGNDNGKKELKADKRGGKRGAEAPNPFGGLNLTADQQTKLEALKKECKEARMAKAETRQKQAQERKNVNRVEAKKARTEELAKIKAILTPEQYVKFLENSYLTGRHGKKGAKDNGRLANNDRRGDRGHKHAGNRGNRPAPQPQN